MKNDKHNVPAYGRRHTIEMEERKGTFKRHMTLAAWVSEYRADTGYGCNQANRALARGPGRGTGPTAHNPL